MSNNPLLRGALRLDSWDDEHVRRDRRTLFMWLSTGFSAATFFVTYVVHWPFFAEVFGLFAVGLSLALYAELYRHQRNAEMPNGLSPDAVANRILVRALPVVMLAGVPLLLGALLAWPCMALALITDGEACATSWWVIGFIWEWAFIVYVIGAVIVVPGAQMLARFPWIADRFGGVEIV